MPIESNATGGSTPPITSVNSNPEATSVNLTPEATSKKEIKLTIPLPPYLQYTTHTSYAQHNIHMRPSQGRMQRDPPPRYRAESQINLNNPGADFISSDIPRRISEETPSPDEVASTYSTTIQVFETLISKPILPNIETFYRQIQSIRSSEVFKYRPPQSETLPIIFIKRALNMLNTKYSENANAAFDRLLMHPLCTPEIIMTPNTKGITPFELILLHLEKKHKSKIIPLTASEFNTLTIFVQIAFLKKIHDQVLDSPSINTPEITLRMKLETLFQYKSICTENRWTGLLPIMERKPLQPQEMSKISKKLLYTIETNNAELLKKTLDEAKVSDLTNEKTYPLQAPLMNFAILANKTQLLKIILEAPICCRKVIQALDYHKESTFNLATMLAIESNNPENLTLLINSGHCSEEMISRATASGHSLLQLCILKKNSQIFTILVSLITSIRPLFQEYKIHLNGGETTFTLAQRLLKEEPTQESCRIYQAILNKISEIKPTLFYPSTTIENISLDQIPYTSIETQRNLLKFALDTLHSDNFDYLEIFLKRCHKETLLLPNTPYETFLHYLIFKTPSYETQLTLSIIFQSKICTEDLLFTPNELGLNIIECILLLHSPEELLSPLSIFINSDACNLQALTTPLNTLKKTLIEYLQLEGGDMATYAQKKLDQLLTHPTSLKKP